jgi:hypothetical protein
LTPRNYTLVGTLATNDGQFLGNIYANYVDSERIASLYIVGKKNEVLYTVDKNGFFSVKGSDVPFSRKGLYGYKILHRDVDRITISVFWDGGTSVSDDLTIRWNYDQKLFEIRKIPI